MDQGSPQKDSVHCDHQVIPVIHLVTSPRSELRGGSRSRGLVGSLCSVPGFKHPPLAPRLGVVGAPPPVPE